MRRLRRLFPALFPLIMAGCFGSGSHSVTFQVMTVAEDGTEQPATFAKSHGFGSMHWRYTIPGHGCVRWTRAFQILEANGYQGAVSIELEDENFNGSEAGEKQGILSGSAFLASC